MGSGNGSSTIQSPDEIKKDYMIRFSETADSGEIRRANAELVVKYQTASTQMVQAKQLYERAARDLRLFEAETTLAVAHEERDKPKDSRLSAKEREAAVQIRVAKSEWSSRVISVEYYFELWRQVIDDLKFVSKRVESAIIQEASERKLQMSAGAGGIPVHGMSPRAMASTPSWDPTEDGGLQIATGNEN